MFILLILILSLSFSLSLLQRTSRGRTIKPPMSTFTSSLQSCGDLYSYDWHGNFTGITSVIDLTVNDDPLPPKRHRRIKKEPVEVSTSDPSHGIVNTNSTAAEELEVELFGREKTECTPAAQQVKGRSSKTKSQKKSNTAAEKYLDTKRGHDMNETQQPCERNEDGRMTDSTTEANVSEDETNGRKSHHKGRVAVRSKRRKVKGHSTDVTTSGDSDVESNYRSRLVKTCPAPSRKRVDRQKLLETSLLDWSHSIRLSSEAGSEKEENAKTHHVMQDGGSGELISNQGRATARKFSDKDLHNLRQ